MSGPYRVFWLVLAVSISAAQEPAAAEPKPVLPVLAKARVDLFDDPLPPGTLARMGTIRLRPGGTPKFMVFSAEGKQLICFAGGYGTANALVHFDVASGKEIRRVELLDSRVLAATMTADGRGLAIVLLVPGERSYYLWEFTDPKSNVPRPKTPLQPNTSYDDIVLTISPDGRWVASAGRNSGEAESPVRVRPWTSGRMLLDLKPAHTWKLGDSSCNGLWFTHDSKELLAACREKEEKRVEFRLFDLSKGQQRSSHKVIGVDSSYWPSYTFALAPQGMLALGFREENGRFLDLAAGKEPRPLPFPVVNEEGKNPGLSALTFSGDGRHLAAGDWDGWLRLWDLGKERVVWQFRGTRYEMRSLAFSRDGRRLASAGSDGLIRLWDATTGKESCILPALQGSPRRLVLSRDGRAAVSASHNDRRLQHWDMATGSLLREITCDQPFHDMGFVPGTDQLIVAHGKRVDRWDLHKNQWEPIALEKGQGLSGRFRFSADGKTLINIDSDRVSVWDWAHKKLRRRWSLGDPKNPQESIEGICSTITKDGGKALIHAWHYKKNGDSRQYDKQSVTVWDANEAKKLAFSFPEGDDVRFLHFNHHVEFTPEEDGLILCMFNSFPVGYGKGSESLRWLDLSTGKLRRKFIAPANPRSSQQRVADYAAFSPDGRILASAERDGPVVLYEAATGLPRRVLEGHRNDVWLLAFTLDGRRLVTFSSDLTGLVWDLSLAPAVARKLTKVELAQAWKDLANHTDGGKVHQAMATLAGDPLGAVAMIRQHLPPARAPDAKHLARLLAELDNPNFAVRTKAFAELDRLGDGVVGFLRQELTKSRTVEVTRRLQSLVEKHDPADLPPDRLRTIRAVEVLEHLGTPAAREVLESLAQGSPAASLTRAARAADERLRRISP